MRRLSVTVSVFGLLGLTGCGGGGGGGGASPSSLPAPPAVPTPAPPAPAAPTPTTPAPTAPEVPAAPAVPETVTTPPAVDAGGSTGGEPDETAIPGGSGEETPPVQEEPASPPQESDDETPAPDEGGTGAGEPGAGEPVVWDGPEYAANPSMAQLKPGPAYERGLTGLGVRIAILGAPVDQDNPEFVGRLTDAGEDFGSILRDNASGPPSVLARPADSFVHDERQETRMAAVAAGARDYFDFHGVAPGAQIISFRMDQIRQSVDGTRTGQSSSSGWTNNARAIDAGLDQGITLFVQGGGLAAYAGATVDGTAITDWYRGQAGFAQFQAANDRIARDGALIVYAAGDGAGPNGSGASTAANWLLVNADNRDNIVLVGAVDADNVILTDSARAGLAQDNYLVAPGSWLATGPTGGQETLSGTAYAAASVAGAAALMMERWPQLRGEDIADILFSTATDLGASGVDAVYGRGLVDIEAAMQPQNAQVGTGFRETAVALTGATLPEGFGTQDLQGALSSVTVLDAFGRDYQASLGGLVTTSTSLPSLYGRVQSLATDRVTGFATPRLSASFSYQQQPAAGRDETPMTRLGSARLTGGAGRLEWQLGLRTQGGTQAALGLAPTGDGLAAHAPGADNSVALGLAAGRGRIGLIAASGTRGTGRAAAVAVEYGRGGTSLRAGLVHERSTVLGAESTGALKLGSSVRTLLVEAKQRLSLAPGWTLDAYGSASVSRIKADRHSLFADWSDIVGTRFGFTVNGDLGRFGRLDFGLAQPLTIERAGATLLVPNGYDRGTRTVAMTGRRVDLAADERRLLLSAGFAKSWEQGTMLQIGAVQSLAGDATGAVASLGWRF